MIRVIIGYVFSDWELEFLISIGTNYLNEKPKYPKNANDEKLAKG